MLEKNLTTRQFQVLPYLLESSTIEEAARKAKISSKQIHEWMKDDLFKNALNSKRDEIFANSLAMVKNATSKAVQTLISLLDNENSRIRLCAADKILDHAFHGFEILELENKITALENRIDKTLSDKN